MQNKPELLLPAGNIESFFAAMQAGADAVYLGLMQFNARGRARNFTNHQLIQILQEAGKKKVSIYVTVNTVIKNSEIGLLTDYLHFLNEAGVDGIIVQDWGVFYLAKQFFPKLKIHASTQMGIHNSLGTRFAGEKEFRRVVLARELTLKELETVAKKTEIETEVFVHGALCYSFSGMCLFSSFVGGRGANRGMCAQPCRRSYNSKTKEKFLFNLKDNQLLHYVPRLAEMGINSLKIEGRLKSGEYTYTVGKAYRKVLDNENKIAEATQELELDMGRQKTSYFFGGDIKDSISDETGTGIFLGIVKQVSGNKIFISSAAVIEPNFRLRIHQPGNAEPDYINVGIPVKDGAGFWVDTENKKITILSRVYLIRLKERKFPTKLESTNQIHFKNLSPDFKKNIIESLKVYLPKTEEKLYFRIGSADWLQRINFNELDGLFLSFSKATWNRLDVSGPFIQENRGKIFIEFPKFIAEGSIGFYADLAKRMVQNGILNFVVSHLSQKLLIPGNCRILTNENVYVFNDSASKLIQSEGVENFIYPFEIDFETLESLSNKGGIVPLFFYPELFYSRMPVQLENNNEFAAGDFKTKFMRLRKNGITIIVPDRPVSILHHKNRLSANGFSRFLIDVCYDQFSKNRLKTLKTRFLKSGQIQPSVTFNFTKGMK